jgi:hypothetical protein
MENPGNSIRPAGAGSITGPELAQPTKTRTNRSTLMEQRIANSRPTEKSTEAGARRIIGSFSVRF